jgi:hypothetical protein
MSTNRWESNTCRHVSRTRCTARYEPSRHKSSTATAAEVWLKTTYTNRYTLWPRTPNSSLYTVFPPSHTHSHITTNWYIPLLLSLFRCGCPRNWHTSLSLLSLILPHESYISVPFFIPLVPFIPHSLTLSLSSKTHPWRELSVKQSYIRVGWLVGWLVGSRCAARFLL